MPIIKGAFTKWVAIWLVPLSAAIAMASGVYLQIRDTIRLRDDMFSNEIKELNTRIDRMSGIGPDGLIDPAVHSSLDKHMQHWAESEFGRAGWRKLLYDYATDGSNGYKSRNEAPK